MGCSRGRRDGGGTRSRMREKLFAIGADYCIETDEGERVFNGHGLGEHLPPERRGG